MATAAGALVSFISEADHRIDACRAARGDESREQSDQPEQGHRREECYRIDCAYTVEEAGGGASGEIGARRPYRETEEDERHALPHNEADHVRRLPAQRHSNTDLLRPLTHSVRHDAVDAHRR